MTDKIDKMMEFLEEEYSKAADHHHAAHLRERDRFYKMMYAKCCLDLMIYPDDLGEDVYFQWLAKETGNG